MIEIQSFDVQFEKLIFKLTSPPSSLRITLKRVESLHRSILVPSSHPSSWRRKCWSRGKGGEREREKDNLGPLKLQRDRKEPWTEASSSSSSSLLLPNPFPLLELVAMIPLPPLECQQSVETERERESNNRFLPGWKSFPGNVVNVNYKRARYKYIFMCVCVKG